VLGAEGCHLFDRHFPALLEGGIWRNCLRRSTASADRRWLASGHGWARLIMVFLCLAIVRRRGAVSPEPAAAHFHTDFKQGRIPCPFLPIVAPIIVSQSRLGKVPCAATRLRRARARPEPAAIDVSHRVPVLGGRRRRVEVSGLPRHHLLGLWGMIVGSRSSQHWAGEGLAPPPSNRSADVWWLHSLRILRYD
jgi:hypothetical protein